MNARRVVQIFVPRGDREDVAQSVHDAVSAAFEDARLLSQPRVEVIAGPTVDIRVDRESVPFSARRIEQAILAGAGSVRGPGEFQSPRELLKSRLQQADSVALAGIFGALVDSALRSARPTLIRAERAEIARQLNDKKHDQDRLTDAVGLAADLGVNPVDLADGVIDDAPNEPYAAADRLVRGCLERQRQDPVIEAEAFTLRRLTTGPRALRSELIVGTDPPGPLGLAHRLYRSYGLRTAPVRLALDDRLSRSLVRFSFGAGGRSAAHLVPPDDLAAVTLAPSDLRIPARLYIDPVFGESWSLVHVGEAHDLVRETGARMLDSSALVTNAMLAEMMTRLQLWAPTGDAFQLFELGPIDNLPLSATAAAVRRLLASRISLQGNARLMEAAVLLAAAGVEQVEQIETGLRSLLGRSVVPPMVPTTCAEVIEVDAELARAATAPGSLDVLLRQLPQLTSSVTELVVTVPRSHRRGIERLLAPLRDVLLVVAEEELKPLPTAPTSMPLVLV